MPIATAPAYNQLIVFISGSLSKLQVPVCRGGTGSPQKHQPRVFRTLPSCHRLFFFFGPFVISWLSWLSWLPDNLRNRHAVHIGEPCVAAVEPVSELLMIDPQQLQNRCVQIVIRNRLLLRLVAELVTGSNGLPALDAGAGHPDRHRAGIVIAPDASLGD